MTNYFAPVFFITVIGVVSTPIFAFDLQITEIWPGNEPGSNLSNDWFEITNNGSRAWVAATDGNLFFDDDSQDPTTADLISGIDSIQPGESVIAVEGNSAADVQEFIDLWSPVVDLDNVQVGLYDGAGLSQAGDGVTLFISTETPSSDDIVDFETYPNAESNGGQSYDIELSTFSTIGNTNNAVATNAVNDQNQAAIASPGNIAPTNQVPLPWVFSAVLGLALVSIRSSFIRQKV